MNESEINFAVAVVTVRILAGILFFFQGYDKVFKVGMKDLQRTMQASLEPMRLPGNFIGIIAITTSWIELLGGFLLILGFFKFYAIYLLCLNMIVVALGFSLAKPMWESGHVLIRLILLIFLLVTPVEWDLFSVDYLFQLSKLSH